MNGDADIVKALEQIAKVLAGIALRGENDQIRKIARLKECGLQNAEIAKMLGTTANTVNVAVHSLRHKKKGILRSGKKKKETKRRK